MSVIIKRISSVSDIKQAADLVKKVLLVDFPTYSPATIRQYRQKVFTLKYFLQGCQNKNYIMWGAFDKMLVGFIALKNEYNGGVMFIDWLAVAKEYRQRGVGSKLILLAEKHALARHCHFLYLYTETPANIRFYQKKGFNYVARLDNSWFGETEHLMTKQLRPKPFPSIFK